MIILLSLKIKMNVKIENVSRKLEKNLEVKKSKQGEKF